jgi:hypothetical protein
MNFISTAPVFMVSLSIILCFYVFLSICLVKVMNKLQNAQLIDFII